MFSAYNSFHQTVK